MTMLTYKKWKLLNESFGTPLTLGLAMPQSLGAVGRRWSEGKRSKKMLGGGMGGGGDMGGGMGGDMGGGDMGGGEDMGPPMKMKKKKKHHHVPADMGGDEDLGDEEEDLGDEEEDLGDEEEDLGDEEEDLGDEEEDLGDEEEDLGDEEEDLGDEEMGDMGGGMPMPKKKKPNIHPTDMISAGAQMMKHGMKKMAKMKEGCHGRDDMPGDEEEGDDRDMPDEVNFCKKCKKSKKSKKMTKEEVEFFKSLKNQLGQTHFRLNRDGSVVEEDAIIPPSGPNAALVDNEPGPGEVGYAPQGRIGNIGSYAEWKSRHTGKSLNECRGCGKGGRKKTRKKAPVNKSWFS